MGSRVEHCFGEGKLSRKDAKGRKEKLFADSLRLCAFACAFFFWLWWDIISRVKAAGDCATCDSPTKKN